MMDTIDIFICTIAISIILIQALVPKLRHSLMTVGAAICLSLVWFKTGSIAGPLSNIPLDVMLILVGLTLYGDFVLHSNIFAVMIRVIADICQGNKILIYLFFSCLIFLISALLNNYQAVLLLTPALIGILSQLPNLNKGYVNILFATVILLSNLGGASLPISDFPALVMFAQGIITFESYVPTATPLVIIAACTIVFFGWIFVRFYTEEASIQESELSATFTKALYRGVKLDQRKLFWSGAVFVGMMFFWIKGVNPAVVTTIGLSVLALIIDKGHFLEKRIRSLDSSIFIFYLSLFAVIATIQSTPLLDIIANWIKSSSSNPQILIILFSATTMIVTAFVSAGPATVALLPVAIGFIGDYPENMIITCFALSICAGSSFFTFSATAGPLVQSLTEEHELKVNGRPMSFGSKEYFIPGIIGSSLIFGVNIIYILITL